MVVSGPEGLRESRHIRKFNIKEAAGQTGDDLAMMKEVS